MWQVIDYDQVNGGKIKSTSIFRNQAVLKEATVILNHHRHPRLRGDDGAFCRYSASFGVSSLDYMSL
jgi:hypothetical protein